MSFKTNVGTPVPCGHHPYNLGVFIGRFQPLHNGHLHVIIKALDNCDVLTILVGSSDEPRDYFNPFTYEERRAMIEASIPEHLRARVLVQPLLDWTYNDPRWIKGVQDAAVAARNFFDLDEVFAKIALVGHQKDGTSFYLKMFPQYGSLGIAGFESGGKELSATDIRNLYFLEDTTRADLIPDATIGFMIRFSCSEDYTTVKAEYEHVQKYHEPYKTIEEGGILPYEVIFQTVDAVVVQSGHVLLVKRRGLPGKGLWALPGGFLNAKERIEDAYLRELREETKIKVPEPVLKGCTTKHRRFDEVYRSSRGRTITDAFLVELRDSVELPKVKGADDAEKARWVPLADIKRSMMFEDHYHIISVMTGAF